MLVFAATTWHGCTAFSRAFRGFDSCKHGVLSLLFPSIALLMSLVAMDEFNYNNCGQRRLFSISVLRSVALFGF